MVESGAGGTNQARFERDVISEQVAARLRQLELGSASLVFGRIDLDGSRKDESYYIGRLGVWDSEQEPAVVDWRAPIAEAFYRATGVEPMGLERRRHFATRGRTLLGIDDELFGDLSRLDRGADGAPVDGNGRRIQGEGALIAALESSRTGRLGDIVATIQGEQDEIIRAPLPGVLVVQGGPGTGKTVVALHRAAYLLYTNRFPLEGQGVLVVGPNRLFLAYIEQVLPSLGEAGIKLAILGDLLVPSVRITGPDNEAAARLKGDLVMPKVIRRAVRMRQNALRDDLVVGFGLERLRLTIGDSEHIISEARRRFVTHNAARKFVARSVFEVLANSSRDDELDWVVVRERLRSTIELRETLEWMWPVLTPAQLLHDLYGSKAMLRASGGDDVASERMDLLFRPRTRADDVTWTLADAPVLDEARERLGARPGRREEDDVRTYGHIVVDEAQDLSPMELRMLERRSLNGSMTIVGDIAQSTSAWAHDSWASILEHLPQKREPRRAELTIGYRIPAPLMEVAGRVLREAAPGLSPPKAIRDDGEPPTYVHAEPGQLVSQVVDVVGSALAEIGTGNVSVIVPNSMADTVAERLIGAGFDTGRANRSGLDRQLTVVPVGLVKGLEVDFAIVVEPAQVLSEEPQGMRSLYVALTRSTKRIAIVHEQPLPAVLQA